MPFPPQHTTRNKGHGRIEHRQIWVSRELVGYSDFPYLQQAIRVARTWQSLSETDTHTEVRYAITSLSPEAASPARLLELIREHWAIENRVHYVRDRIFDEDRSQVRKSRGPHAMASLRNVALSLLRLAGAANIAATLRFCARHVRTILRLIGV